jgi:hypothetical protein
MAWSADGQFKGPLESAAPAIQEALRLADISAVTEPDDDGLTLAGKTPAGQRVRVRLTRRGKSEGETVVRVEWDEFPDPDLGVSLLKVMEDVAVEARAREEAAPAGKEDGAAAQK